MSQQIDTQDYYVPEGFGLQVFDVLDSTNEEAKRLFQAGMVFEPTWIVAQRQEQGRGRHGRQWVSTEGNLFTSLLLHPNVPPQRLAEFSFVASLAVADAMRGLNGIGMQPIQVKWPNDILINGAKVSGILLEATGAPQMPSLIIGIGVNVQHHPDNVLYPTIDLSTVGGESYSPADMFSNLAEAFAFFYQFWMEQGFEEVKRLWLAEAKGVGDMITIRHGEGEKKGLFLDLAENGSLILGLPDGTNEVIHAGDVFF